MLESPISRRAMLARCALFFLPSIVRAQAPFSPPTARFRALELSSGARIGVAALDTGNGAALFYRENERFLFCSTWKFLVVAALLARVDQGKEDLSRVVHFGKSDLVPYAPVTMQHVEDGMTLDALCQAAMTVSDNAAANLLLTAVGGFEKFNAFVRSLGDRTTRLDRNEPTLNDPDGDKDTTTPLAMLHDLRMIPVGKKLKADSHAKLMSWLLANTTGNGALRAGLPHGWAVGDKTGHGDVASNDIAIVTPPGRKPILIAAYTRYARGNTTHATLLAEMGKIVAESFSHGA